MISGLLSAHVQDVPSQFVDLEQDFFVLYFLLGNHTFLLYVRKQGVDIWKYFTLVFLVVVSC